MTEVNTKVVFREKHKSYTSKLTQLTQFPPGCAGQMHDFHVVSVPNFSSSIKLCLAPQPVELVLVEYSPFLFPKTKKDSLLDCPFHFKLISKLKPNTRLAP